MITLQEKQDLRTLSDLGLIAFKNMIEDRLDLYGATKPTELLELNEELILIMKERGI